MGAATGTLAAPGGAARDRLLAAAAEEYAARGFVGATTRRIATIADVNETTLFRQFGSKARLIDAAVRRALADGACASLPMCPHDPVAELTLWIDGQITHLRRLDRLRRRLLADAARPTLAAAADDEAAATSATLAAYVQRLVADARVSPAADAPAAVRMLTVTLYAEALAPRARTSSDAGDVVPMAPDRFAHLFLGALGAATQRSGRATSRLGS